MKLTEEQGTQIQARIDQLEDEKRALDARIDELQTLLWGEMPICEPPGLLTIDAGPIVKAMMGQESHEVGNGHKSTTDPEVFGINPHKDYTTKAVIGIWGGDNGTWRKKFEGARKSGKLKYTLKGHGFYYRGEDLIRWRQGIEKKGK